VATGLDPQDPRDWRRLLIELASVLFEVERRGPKPKWDAKLWEQFKRDALKADKTLKKGDVYPSHAEVAAYLCRRRPWKDFGKTAVRSYLSRRPPKAISN
jgi:hypothetical protein